VIVHVGEPMIPAATPAVAWSAAYKGPMELIGIEFDGILLYAMRTAQERHKPACRKKQRR
jgi:hypothetical protein